MEPKGKNTEPGWNDPPLFSYTETLGHIRSPKRPLLNKRVAYPVGDNTKNGQSTSTPHYNSELPPLAMIPPLMMLPSDSISTNDNPCDRENSTSSGIDPAMSENMLQTVLANINEVMMEKEQILRNQNSYEQIKKKIHILEEAWKNKLSDEIKEKLLQLSTVMKKHDKNRANEIHASLMVDYPKLCSEFIPALRMIINSE